VDPLSQSRRFGHARGKPQRASTGRSTIVAHVSGGGGRGAQAADQVLENGTLVSGTLFYERDAKLGGADLDGARATRGKNGDLDPALLQHLSRAVLSVECLQLGSGSLKYSVPSVSTLDIEDHQAQPAHSLRTSSRIK